MQIRDRFMRVIAALVGSMTFVAASPDAHAHGSAPAVLDVLSDDPDASRLRLSVGLAERADEGWRWICPASWGGPETPVVADSADGIVVFADEGMVRVESGVGVFVGGGEDLTASTVRAAAADEDVFILASLEDEYLLLRQSEGPPTTVAQLRENWQTLDVRAGAPLLGAVRDGQLVVAEVRPEGTGVSEQAYPVDAPDGASASLRVRGDRTFVVVSSAGDYRLLELTGADSVEVFASTSFIHGPMPIGETLLTVSDGALWELGDNSRVLDDRVRYTCAAWSPQASFICSQTALFEVFEGGAATIPTFQHSDLRPPLQPSGSCQGEWLDYAGHAGIDLGDDQDAEPNPEPGDESSSEPKSGCSSAPQSSPWLIFVTLAWLQLTRLPRSNR